MQRYRLVHQHASTVFVADRNSRRLANSHSAAWILRVNRKDEKLSEGKTYFKSKQAQKDTMLNRGIKGRSKKFILSLTQAPNQRNLEVNGKFEENCGKTKKTSSIGNLWKAFQRILCKVKKDKAKLAAESA